VIRASAAWFADSTAHFPSTSSTPSERRSNASSPGRVGREPKADLHRASKVWLEHFQYRDRIRFVSAGSFRSPEKVPADLGARGGADRDQVMIHPLWT
jgi:hypothetical protein